MKSPLLLLLGALALAPAIGRAAQVQTAPTEIASGERDATAAALVRLIAARLDGAFWSVRYEPQFDLIEVQSRNPALIEPEYTINGPMLSEKPKPIARNFGFSLRVESLISTADYASFHAENAALAARLEQMQAQMKGISHKFDSYLPRDAAEKARVDAYNRAKAQRHFLPLFYFRDISLSVVYYNGQSPFDPLALFDPKPEIGEQPQWQRQQKAAALAVSKLLTRYQSAAP